MNAIVAVDANWGIGQGNELLFTLRGDLKRFREMTTGGTILLGRKTLETFPGGRPLPHRRKGVLTKSHLEAEGATVVPTGPGTGLAALLAIPNVQAGTESAAFPTGTGPYAYSGEGGPHLTANPHWWQSGKVPAETIGLSAAEDRDTMLYQFTSHDLQLITADLPGTAPVSVTGSEPWHQPCLRGRRLPLRPRHRCPVPHFPRLPPVPVGAGGDLLLRCLCRRHGGGGLCLRQHPRGHAAGEQ